MTKKDRVGLALMLSGIYLSSLTTLDPAGAITAMVYVVIGSFVLAW